MKEKVRKKVKLNLRYVATYWHVEMNLEKLNHYIELC